MNIFTRTKGPAVPVGMPSRAAGPAPARGHAPCWKCLLRAAKTAAVFFAVFLTLMSGVIWWDNREIRKEVTAFQPSPRFQQHLTKMNIQFEPKVRQPYVASWVLDMLPHAAACGLAGESAVRKLMCPVLELLPYSTSVGIAVVDARGRRLIRINEWGDWDVLTRPLKATPVPTKHVVAWAIWHELAHVYQLNKGGIATNPWFDANQTHQWALYKETHADIFSLMSIGQEPGVTKADLQKLVKGVITIRRHYAAQDAGHATDEFLTCLTVDEYITKGNVVPAAQKLFETALKRKAAGACFNSPPAPKNTKA